MTIYEFASLDLTDKANELWAKGELIQNYKDQNQSCILYFIHNFYVEVALDKTGIEILHITPFKRGNLLDKYVTFITLNL